MKVHSLSLIGLALVTIALTSCVTENGRLRPIDPIGKAIFNALDPGSNRHERQDNNNYRYQNRRDNVWMEGAYGRDSHGRRVWVPAHWAH